MLTLNYTTQHLIYCCLFALLFLCFSKPLNAGDLFSTVRNDDFLCNENVSFIQIKDKTYLVSVGRSTIRRDFSQAKLNAMKEAKLKSESLLSNFVHDVKVTSRETLETTSTTKQSVKNGKVQDVDREIEEKYTEFIREKGGGVLRKVFKIGKWKEKTDYFYASGILMPN